MALITCHECKNEVSTEAKVCPKCGAAVRSSSNTAGSLIAIAVVAIGVWYFFGGGLEHQAAKDMTSITQQVANDSVQQYQIAKKNGGPMDACVHAGLVSAAYLQAKDEVNYQRWKATESTDCEKAGLPR